MTTEKQTTELAKTENIYAALNALLEDITHVGKNAKGYNFKYASLEDILAAVNPLLFKYKMSIHHVVRCNNGETLLISTLAHISGQVIESQTPLIYDAADMKQLGSTITYARRYAIQCLLNLAFTDGDLDDPKSPGPTKNKGVAPASHGLSERMFKKTDIIKKTISNDEVGNLKKIINNNTDVINEIYRAFGIRDLGELTPIRYEPAIKHIQTLLQKGA